MPAMVTELTNLKKRKALDSDSRQRLLRKEKKRKQLEEAGQPNIQSEILLLESRIIESRLHYNKINQLIEYLSVRKNEDERDIVAAIGLCRVFCKLMAQGNMTASQEAPDNEVTIVQWLLQRYGEYQKALVNLFHDDAQRQSTALTLSMRLLKEEAVQMEPPEQSLWLNGSFTRLLGALTDIPEAREARTEFCEKYLNRYHDIRYYVLLNLSARLKDSPSAQVTSNILFFLSTLESTPEKQEDLNPSEQDNFYTPPPSNPKHKVLQLSHHKKRVQAVWIALLQHDLDHSQRKKVLSMLSEQIAPWFLKPEMLLDFLTDSFDAGGAMSLMALSGLFFLMREKNLDYPHFYQKLYSMLDADLLHSKHRSRFFRLLDTFLASTHLPATLVASFIKRMSRLAIHAPPPAIVVIVPWVYNLLRSHPTCTFMIHRQALEEEYEDGEYHDPYDMEEPDPTATGAIDSSLWEMEALQSHYHPNVATVCKIISEPFTKQAYNTEDFLDHSYASLLQAELGREIKRPPEIEFQIPKRIFVRNDPSSNVDNGLVTTLWDFR